MLIQIRGCPNWKTSSTLVVATTALIDTIYPIHCWPILSNTNASGSLTFNNEKFTIPVSTNAIKIYSTVQMINELIIPLGKSRWGLRHSSAVVEMASKPMYA